MVKQKYDIIGMTCSACSAHVEKAARAVSGVCDVNVNLLTNSMVVESETPIASSAIVDAIAAAGYSAIPVGQQDNQQKTEKSPREKTKRQIEQMQLRLCVSFAFLVPLMYIAMGHMIGLPLPSFLLGYENSIAFAMTQFLLTLPVVYVNRKYYQTGFKTLFHGNPNMDSLIAIGSTAALVYGVFAIMRMGYGLGTGNRALVEQYHMDLYFESAAMILTLITLGKYLETKSKGKTSEAIARLMDLTPKTATVERNGQEKVIPVEQLIVGDIILVKPGQSVPVDGVIIEGDTHIDEAAITGESIPVEKTVGSTVLSATLNKTGFFKFRATKVGQDTTLAQIIRLVEDASASKAPIAKLADQISGIFVPIVITIALAATLVWLWVGQSVEFSISVGIAVLVVSCPCALGLATPVAIMVGTGKGAENGILIKSGEALQTAHDINAVVLDKTGTITQGQPVVTDIFPLQGFSEMAFLQIAASIEKRSEHPLAQAIVERAEKEKVELTDVEDFSALFGKGVRAVLNGQMWFAGNEKLMNDQEIKIPDSVRSILNDLAEDGKTPLLFASRNQGLAGIIAVADEVKETSREAIDALHKMGIEVTMLTGDNRRTATAIQKQVGIEHLVAEVLPQEKEQQIALLQKNGKRVAMVGDGVNDAPALARADVGIAIGAGTDVAIESADIVLMKNDLRDVVTAIRLSKAVIRNIKENLFWAFFYNSVGIPLAAGLFFPIFGIKLSPMFGAAAMSLSSVCVVSNALRLRRFKSYSTSVTVPFLKNKKEEVSMKTVKIQIDGMMCQHCVAHVTQALNQIPGVTAQVSLEEKQAVCSLDESVTVQQLKDAIAAAGYTVTGVN
ncbi:heavy metal translocating P-type ATPase [uncultured Ruthenibacterium sp.]|uniref:heavy metal translocating P-type ATPase n=1 Tax=uncultured Ruthenibacterium sp. TaxID=1905347 RepID=UPI00349EC3A9